MLLWISVQRWRFQVVIAASALGEGVNMTDARIPGAWGSTPWFIELDWETRGVFLSSLAWCAEHGTDGAITDRYILHLTPDVEFPDAACQKLVEIGKWERIEGGYQFKDWAVPWHMDGLGQRTRAQVEESKRAARERQARKRAHDGGDHGLCIANYCSVVRQREQTRDVTRDVGEGEGYEAVPQIQSNEVAKMEGWIASPDTEEGIGSEAFLRSEVVTDVQESSILNEDPLESSPAPGGHPKQPPFLGQISRQSGTFGSEEKLDLPPVPTELGALRAQVHSEL